MQPNIPELTRLSPQLAHRVRNDISAIRDAMKLLIDDQSLLPDATEKIEFVDAHLGRVAQHVRQFLMLTNSDIRIPVDISATIHCLRPLTQRLLDHCSLQIDIDRDVWPVGCTYVGQFEELIIPLIVNAREAMPASGSVCIRACNLSNTDFDIKSDREAAAKDFVHIQVIDTGVGISSEALNRIFDPFFSTKGPGCGFTLTQARAAIEALGGKIAANSEVGRGTIFSLFLPQFTDEASSL